MPELLHEPLASAKPVNRTKVPKAGPRDASYSRRQDMAPTPAPVVLPMPARHSRPAPPTVTETPPVSEPQLGPDGPPANPLDDSATLASLNRQAAVIENVYFPSMTLQALGLDEKASITAM